MSWRLPARLVVVREVARLHPLAWIHRAEAQSIVEELRGAGCDVRVAAFGADSVQRLPPGPLLLRVSDPVMLDAARALTDAAIAYVGPDRWENQSRTPCCVSPLCADCADCGRLT